MCLSYVSITQLVHGSRHDQAWYALGNWCVKNQFGMHMVEFIHVVSSIYESDNKSWPHPA
jgi:hypothetical protein